MDFHSSKLLAHEADFTVGAMRVHPSLSEVEIAGEPRHLEPRVMQVLVALARAEGGVLSRDDLIDRCWDGVVVGEDAINRVIGKVRRLTEHDQAGFHIQTLPRIGYRLINAEGEATIDGAGASDGGAGSVPLPRSPDRWTLLPRSWAPPWRAPCPWR